MTELPLLWSASELPTFGKERSFKGLKHPLWTEHKARLIQAYMKLFTMVTKHGTYIDGFAAPQQRDRLDLCSAALVLQAEPKWMKRFVLCDVDPAGVAILQQLALDHTGKGRRVHVVAGDFNENVTEVLTEAAVKPKTATFALLDQRTFECRWATVERLARHKAEGLKIELFYFFPTGWVDRSIAAIRKPETAKKVESWWGKSDWRELRAVSGLPRARAVADRFKNELGYRYAYPYPIHSRGYGGRTMYHMIHATDHDEAPVLMMRAYRRVSGRTDLDLKGQQFDLEALWNESQEELPAHFK